jgi:hypothetical protein
VRRILASILSVVCACLLVTGTPQVSAASTSDVASACLHYSGHRYEVCTAYLANATAAARVPFYQLSRKTGPAYYHAVRENCTGFTVGTASTCRMFSRYYGSARRKLLAQVVGWPKRVEVSTPRIHINAVTSNLATNTATLRVHETWRVTTVRGRVLFSETRKAHTITMARVPGIFLHKWVVTSIA